jgi:mitogen-activated protein kinase 15
MAPRRPRSPCSLLNVLKAENDRDIYLVFEYMETDLHAGARQLGCSAAVPSPGCATDALPPRAAVIRANILEGVHKQYIMYQLFKCARQRAAQRSTACVPG